MSKNAKLAFKPREEGEEEIQEVRVAALNRGYEFLDLKPSKYRVGIAATDTFYP